VRPSCESLDVDLTQHRGVVQLPSSRFVFHSDVSTDETSKIRDEWIDPKLSKTPCGGYIDGWLATKVNIARSTKLNIEGRIIKHIRPFFGDMPVTPYDRPTLVPSSPVSSHQGSRLRQ
jgi:hypothetical protein